MFCRDVDTLRPAVERHHGVVLGSCHLKSGFLGLNSSPTTQKPHNLGNLVSNPIRPQVPCQ